MTNDFDAEAAKRVIYDDNINITEANPLKDFFQTVLSLVLILACIYVSVFCISGIIIKSLSVKKQVALENFISPVVDARVAEISSEEQNRLYKIKNNILSLDKKFPKTSNLDIKVIKNSQLNAMCYPNGNIYITSGLYKKLETDEEFTFVIAHEMAHYKHKDHLLALRQNISNIVVIMTLVIANPSGKEIETLAEGGLNLTDLKFSRTAEENADKYAIKMLNKLYGNAKAGVKVMSILKNDEIFNIEFLSTHPNIDNRIKYIKKFSNK